MARGASRTSETIKLNPAKRKVVKGGADFVLIMLTTILSVFGMVMVFSASYYNSINDNGTPYSYLWKQAFFVVSGFVILGFTANMNYRVWKIFAYPLAAVGVVLLLLLFTPMGRTINGATRWLYIGVKSVGFTIMPGELAKLFLIIICATYFSVEMERARKLTGILPVFVYTAIVGALIIKQPNLSTAITVVLISVGIAFLAGMQWRYIIMMVGAAVGGGYYLFFIDKGYWHERVISFMDPFADALGGGYQVVQGLLALGSGGFLGKGLGQSVQKNLYLPEPQNDFILAIVGEELGFIGILALMAVYALLVWRIFHICIRAKDNFGMLFSAGVAIMIATQVILNVAVVTSSMPPTGIALPFISYGGNSLWIFMFLIGIVLNISKYEVVEEEDSI